MVRTDYQFCERPGGNNGFRVLNMGDATRVCDLPELAASNARDLCHSMLQLIPDSAQRLEVDLSCTQFIDSAGLGALVALRKQVNGRGIRFCLLEPSRRVEHILRETHLHPLFDVVRPSPGSTI